MRLEDITGGPDNHPLEDAPISELRMCLLIQAFDGRPIRYVKPPVHDWEPLLIVAHDDKEFHCDVQLKEDDFQMLERDLEAFKRCIAEPMLNNLDSIAYPSRWGRLLPAIKRSAELLVQP